MIVRRIAEHVKAQNWFAIAIDFLIVVVGVFIGLQVSNWNDTLADRRHANALVSRVVIDLRNEAAVIEHSQAFTSSTISHAKKALDGYQHAPELADKEFVVSAYLASDLIFPPSSRSAYEEMIATGSLDLLDNDALRVSLTSYYTKSWSVLDRQITVAGYLENIRRAIPYEIQAAIIENCYSKPTQVGTITGPPRHVACDFDLPSDVFAVTARTLRDDPELLKDLRFFINSLEDRLRFLGELETEVEALLGTTGYEVM